MWDGPARTIEFIHGDKLVKWHGEADTREDQGPILNTISNNGTLEKWFEEEAEIFTTSRYNTITTLQHEPTRSDVLRALTMQTSSALLGELLVEFGELFDKPSGLPPQRSCDHKIRLLQGTDPVAVRPYRYPHLLKDEIERQCTEMLRNGVIRPSSSPFSSPGLLVKKTDNSWRFCIDFRELNKVAVKDSWTSYMEHITLQSLILRQVIIK